MNQQINLFQPIFRQQKKVFSALAMLQVLLVVLLAFGSIYAYGYRQMLETRERMQALEIQQQEAADEVELYKAKYPLKTRSKQLEQLIARQQRELGEKNLVLQALKTGDFGNTRGFSSFFEGLARQSVSGAWLNSFSISLGGRSIALGGSAVQPELVPVYLQHLSNEPSFEGLTFDSVDMQRSEESPWKVDFELLTRNARLPEKSDG